MNTHLSRAVFAGRLDLDDDGLCTWLQRRAFDSETVRAPLHRKLRRLLPRLRGLLLRRRPQRHVALGSNLRPLPRRRHRRPASPVAKLWQSRNVLRIAKRTVGAALRGRPWL